MHNLGDIGVGSYFPPFFFFPPDFLLSDFFFPPDFLASDFFFLPLDFLASDFLFEPPDLFAEADFPFPPFFLDFSTTAGLPPPPPPPGDELALPLEADTPEPLSARLGTPEEASDWTVKFPL